MKRQLLFVSLVLLGAMVMNRASAQAAPPSAPPTIDSMGSILQSKGIILQHVQSLTNKLKDLRVAAGKLKPGEAGGLNPQPEPPGIPDPTVQELRSGLSSIRGELTKLSSVADKAKVAQSQSKLAEAQAAVNRLARARDQKSANAALDDFAAALKALSQTAGTLGN